MKSSSAFNVTLLVPLLMLSSCDWFKSERTEAPALSGAAVKSDALNVPKEEVLLYINDKPLMSITEFENEFKQFLELQPQYAQMLSFMPDAEYQIFSQFKAERVLDEWAKRNKIDQKSEYQKDLEKIMKLGRRQLAVKYFQEVNPVTISAADVKKFYDENKEMYFASSPGGVMAKGVKFEKEDAAQAFLEKIKAPGAAIDTVAKDQKLTIKSFKHINDKSFGTEEALRTKLLSYKKFPAAPELVKVKDDQYWVIRATGKEEPKYAAFEEVKEKITQHLEGQKRNEVFSKRLEELEKEYGITENKAYFDQKKKLREEEQERMKQEMEQKSKAVKPSAQSASSGTAPVAEGKVAAAKPEAKKSEPQAKAA